eukprot:gene935-1183_t
MDPKAKQELVQLNVFLKLDDNKKGELLLFINQTKEVLNAINDAVSIGVPIKSIIEKVINSTNQIQGSVQVPNKIRLEPPRFSINGAIRPFDRNSTYYWINRDTHQDLLNKIKRKDYILFHGTRSSGKTTKIYEIFEKLSEQGYYPMYITLDDSYNFESKEIFWQRFLLDIKRITGSNQFTTHFDIFDQKFSSVFNKKDVVLFIDEFDRLFTVDTQVRSQILGQMRTWKQSKEDLLIKSVVAIGTFKILYLNNTLERFYSPFNVIDQMPSRDFTLEEISCLFKTFQDIKGVTVDKKIELNILKLTDGHAGLVNLCGRAIDESILSDRKNATFQDWTKLATGLITRLSLYPTTTRMMRNLRISSKECKQLLLQYVKSYPNPISVNNDLNNLSEDTEYLISEGFLKPILTPGSTSSTFDSLRLKSPLIKYCILSMINELDRRNPPLKPFPEENGAIDILDLISTLVPTFDFRSEGKSTKNNRGQGIGSKSNILVPSEAFYHFELVTTIKSWLPTINISPNVRTCITKKDRADIVLSIKNRIYALELVAHTTIKDVTKHINRGRRYKSSIKATDSWIIHFTIGKENNQIKYPSSIPGVGVIH